jgi:hypothetical protein
LARRITALIIALHPLSRSFHIDHHLSRPPNAGRSVDRVSVATTFCAGSHVMKAKQWPISVGRQIAANIATDRAGKLI